MTKTSDYGFELRSEHGSLRQLVRDVWGSRNLIRTLARKDFFVRYRRASIGLLWAVGLPLVQALVLSVVFSKIVRFETGIPFAVFVFSGVLPWQFFSQTVTTGATSVVDGSVLATKIYFPRAVFPLLVAGSGLYGFTPGLLILTAMALGFGVNLGPEILLLIPATMLMVALAVAFGLVLGALQVYFRDVKHIVQAVTLPWFWGSGVFYPLERVGSLRRWVEANPATGMIQFFRAAFGGAPNGWERALWWTLGWTAALWVVAAVLHRRWDRVFVDLL
jgi:lipopolysaccharide transport system permease protein